MGETEPRVRAGHRGWLRRIARIALIGLIALVALGCIAWGGVALAIDGPGAVAGWIYGLGSIALLAFVRPPRWGRLACAVLWLAVLAWWLSIPPRNDRNWLPDVSQLATMRVEGDRMRVENFRNFEYRSEHDFVPRWEKRTYDLSKLEGVDMVIGDWGEKLIVHTIVSWEFEGGEYLCVSIETRKEVGEGYSALRGFFRQFELYYVVGDERDVIGVRTNHRGEHVRIYRLGLTPDEARGMLLAYAKRVNELAEEPTWYNAFTHNCTTQIRLHAVELGIERPWNWRMLVNGKGEELLHMRAMVNDSVPFAEARARADVTEASQAAIDAPDYSRRIRAGILPRPKPQ